MCPAGGTDAQDRGRKKPKPQGHSSSVLRTPLPKEDICVPFDLVRNLAHLEPINSASEGGQVFALIWH